MSIEQGPHKKNQLEHRLPRSYFESGSSIEHLTFNEYFVEAGNSGEHELTIQLGEKVKEFKYSSSGKSTLIITAENPETTFDFVGSGEQNIIVSGIKDASQVKRYGSASGTLEVRSATPRAVQDFKVRIVQAEIDKEQEKLKELHNKLEQLRKE